MNSNGKFLNKISALRIWQHTKRIIYQDLKCKDSSALGTCYSHISIEKKDMITFKDANKSM